MNAPPWKSRPALSSYQQGWRRMLVDMEIPGWEGWFLSEFDPSAMADLYTRAGLSSVMFSCKNLSGLCFWPTTVGRAHPSIGDRDLVEEMMVALRKRNLAACAYYSAIFDNWAFETHPEWRVELLNGEPGEPTPMDRHGICCPNSPGYRDYIRDQIADLFEHHEFDCAFCDMTFWPGICGCRHCRERYRAEAGAEIPEVIDWTSAEWCRFQAARERWIQDFQGLVTGAIRRARPGISVYHNFAVAPRDWTWGVPFSVTEHSDFLGGDQYGDEVEQLVITKLMNNLSQSRPVEFMTFCTVGPDEHVRLKSLKRMRGQVAAAMAESSAIMFIDAIDPVGTANPSVYDRVGTALESASGLERHLGGEPLEDVAVYFSSESKMDFTDNGRPVHALGQSRGEYLHLLAVRGACRILQRAHVPFGVITRRQLTDLHRYQALVLPNVLRMDQAEVEAVREYVRGGGRVYASRYTSLVETSGVRHEDFMLADVFGIHLEREEPGEVAYAKPATSTARAWIDPQRYLSADPKPGSLDGGLLRLRAGDADDVLATLTLPYAHPQVGDVSDQNWASIHSFPPHQDTDAPVIVEHRFGAGRVVYSAVDIEREAADVNDRLFAGLVDALLGEDRSWSCESEPEVWVSAFWHAEDDLIRVAMLNSPPARVPSATLRLRPPHGTHFVAVEDVSAGRVVPFEVEPDGRLRCVVEDLPELTMLVARYAEHR